MAITSLKYSTTMSTVETLDSGATAAAANQTITQNGYDTSKTLTSSTTPAVTKGAKSVVTLSGGAATIDLTSLTTFNGAALTGSGLKVRAIKFKAATANGAAIVVSKGASNGYTGLGASFSVSLPAGGEFVWYDGGNGTAVSGSVKTFDLSGTGSTDNLSLEATFGA